MLEPDIRVAVRYHPLYPPLSSFPAGSPPRLDNGIKGLDIPVFTQEFGVELNCVVFARINGA